MGVGGAGAVVLDAPLHVVQDDLAAGQVSRTMIR